MRHEAIVDLDAAFAVVGDVLDVWRSVAAWPDSPPFSGGVYDSWPNRYAEGLLLCRAELAAVRAFEASEREERRG